MEDYGQISQMQIPADWVEGGPYEFRGGMGTRSFREMHPRADSGAKLCFFYRGLPVKEHSAAAFREVLSKPAHVLVPSEIKVLGEVMRDKSASGEFISVVARTEDINGRRVLVVEGRYIQSQHDVFAYYVDSDGSGKFVQEIYFHAPKEKYLQFSRQAREAMKSIQWK